MNRLSKAKHHFLAVAGIVAATVALTACDSPIIDGPGVQPPGQINDTLIAGPSTPPPPPPPVTIGF